MCSVCVCVWSGAGHVPGVIIYMCTVIYEQLDVRISMFYEVVRAQ